MPSVALRSGKVKMKKLLTKYWPVTVFVLGIIISALAYGAEAVHDHAKATTAKSTQVSNVGLKAVAMLIQEQRISAMTDQMNEIDAKEVKTQAERLRILQIKKSLEAARMSVKTIGSM